MAGSIEEIELEDEAYDVIASWGVMTIIRDPKALIAKIHQALKPGGVWAFNTYDNRSLWGRMSDQSGTSSYPIRVRSTMTSLSATCSMMPVSSW